MSATIAESTPAQKSIGVAHATRADQRLERIVALITVGLPIAGVILAMIGLWNRAVGPTELVLLGVMYFLTTLGLSLGFHRYFSHHSFDTVWLFRAALGVLGSMGAEGPLLFWVATHRRHHQFSDQPGDPHSPVLHGQGLGGLLSGLRHAHIGWLFEHEVTDPSRWARDVLRDRLALRISRQYLLWVAVGLVIPALIGGLVHGTLGGVVRGFIWGGLVRMFLVHHATWATNSLSHLMGSRPYATRDNSRNNFFIALATLGDGWHNNHHAFPRSAAHGLAWWQIDINRGLLLLLERAGLVWNVQRISPRLQQARLRSLATESPLSTEETSSLEH